MLKTIFKYFVELTGHPISASALKQFSKSRASWPLVRPFARVYRLQQQEMQKPLQDYKTIQALFTRQLKAGARPIDTDPNTVISPVDGVVHEMGSISENQTFYIKQQLYHLETLLGSKKVAERYQNGYFFVLYLSPSHYHRIHYPANGTLCTRWALGEKSFPVNSLGEKWGNSPFSTNYRIISELDTTGGKMAMVKVGALNINSICLTNPAAQFTKGDELGYFTFGSTVIVLMEKRFAFIPAIKSGTEIKMGESLGSFHS